jgi:hypothetical protein
MITPNEILLKAEKQYIRFLKVWLKGGEFFPLDIPADKGKSTDPFLKRKQELEKLIGQSKIKKPHGYSLEMKEIKTRKEGIQSIISRIYFASSEDFLTYIGRVEEFERFKKSAALIREALPELDEWIAEHISLIIDNYSIWPDLILVCKYFMELPQPRLYIRELPVPVHTKFIEENQAVLRKLLDFLLPENVINTIYSEFEKRFHLKRPETFIRFRSLDPGYSFKGFGDLAISLSDFKQICPPVKCAVIIENKMTYLTFPGCKDSIAIWGRGFGVEQLKDVEWLANMKLYYWGDMDPAGFEILSGLRSFFPHVCSLMMDKKTYAGFGEWAVAAPAARRISSLTLTEDELAMYEYLLDHPEKNRLEQERIRQDYVIEVVRKVMVI